MPLDLVKNKGHTSIPHMLSAVTGPAAVLHSQKSTRGESTGSTKIAEHNKAPSYPPEQGVRWGTREHPSLPYLSVNLNALKLLPFPTAQQGDAQMCLERQTRIKTLREHQCKPGSKVAREGYGGGGKR